MVCGSQRNTAVHTGSERPWSCSRLNFEYRYRSRRGSSPSTKVTTAHGMSDEDLEQALPGYDAVVIRSANRITRSMLIASPRVAVVGRAGSGVDNIDLEAASELGVPVVNAPTGNAGSVAGQPTRRWL